MIGILLGIPNPTNIKNAKVCMYLCLFLFQAKITKRVKTKVVTLTDVL